MVCTPDIFSCKLMAVFLFSNKSWKDSKIDKNCREIKNERYHINWLTHKRKKLERIFRNKFCENRLAVK